MNLKTYRAASVADALSEIKRDLGAGAVILHTRTVRHGGLFGWRARQYVEITASSDVNVRGPRLRERPAEPATETSPPQPTAQPEFLRRAYAQAPAPSPNRPAAQEPKVAPQPVRKERVAPTPEPARGVISPPNTLLEDELASIKRLVGQVLQKTHGAGDAAMPERLFNRYLRLVQSEVASELASEIVGAVRDELTLDELEDDAVVHTAVLRRLAAHIPVSESAPAPGKAEDGRPLTIALVGPTGVGKTTTIAKLAATYKLRHGKNVGLLTCDTYRIAAVEQLRTYANIMGVPLMVAQTTREMEAGCRALSNCDVILVDTAGRSHSDSGRLDELRSLVDAADPHQVHLVLSGASSESVLLTAAQKFAVLKPEHVIFTKMDETVSFGVVVNAARKIGKRLSFITTGQEVPDHIEPGRADRIARLVLGQGAEA